MQEEINQELVQEILRGLRLSAERKVFIRDAAYKEFKKGLDKEQNASACVKMLPTYVTKLPDGTEKGTFIALDLGGTNFRVLLIDITARNGDAPAANIDSRIYRMPPHAMTGSQEELFDHIAGCIHDFCTRMEIDASGAAIPIGFTFSFPCLQKSLGHAELLCWTKGYSSSGAVGNSVGGMLDDAIQRRGDLKFVKVLAICNDTVGTLMSCAFDNPRCQIGLICGTGSNACYVEQTKHIGTLSEQAKAQDNLMIVNTEFGNMGSDGIFGDIVTEFDREVDEHSPNPGKQQFEKLMAGMYLGEVVRLVMRRLHAQGVLFTGEKVEKLYEKNSLDASFLSVIEEVSDPDDIVTLQNVIVDSLNVGAVRADCEIIYELCTVVSKRAATLCAGAMAAMGLLIGNIDKDGRLPQPLQLTAGVDGSVYRKHPTFGKDLQSITKELLEGTNISVEFELSHDGSGKGAALTVAAASRL